MMSTLHFHYHHHGYGCLCNLPHSDALKFDDADKTNQQLLVVERGRERESLSMSVCVCAHVSEFFNVFWSMC